MTQQATRDFLRLGDNIENVPRVLFYTREHLSRISVYCFKPNSFDLIRITRVVLFVGNPVVFGCES